MGKVLTICVTLALASGVASADSLREAARDATRLCAELDAGSLENCGTEMGGRSAAHSAARMAVMRMMNLRNQFMRGCQFSIAYRDCTFEADIQMEAGLGDALNAPAAYLRSTPPR